MSELTVEIVKVKEVLPHPNADRLDIIKLENLGYTVISQKGNYKPGDTAFYFPIDSVLPEKYIDEFGIRNFYNKKIRATKIRGIFSEGLLIPTLKYKDYSIVNTLFLDDNWTEYFGVTKYEYPVPVSLSGEALRPIKESEYFPSPEHYKKYYSELIEDEEVIITEKIHGTNFTIKKDTEEGWLVGSHNYFWKNNEVNSNNVYIRIFKENPEFQNIPAGWQVYGEIYGVQDLKYGKEKGKIGYALFAIKNEKNQILDYNQFIEWVKFFTIVPILYIGKYSDEIVRSFNGKESALYPRHIMEGIVILPIKERSSYRLKRICLKNISDSYSLRKDGSEFK